MTDILPRIPHPEIFLGFVAPVGSDLDTVIFHFKDHFRRRKYDVVPIKVTDIFKLLTTYVPPKKTLENHPLYKRYRSYIAYGNQLREELESDAILAEGTVLRLVKKRLRRASDRRNLYKPRVYLLNQFKREEEIELLRAVYGRLFFQVSVYSRRGARVEYLSRKFAEDEYSAQIERYRDKAEKLIALDEHEVAEPHGQRVARIFHDADLIINVEAEETVKHQVDRFCELLFSSNSISPTKREYGMHMAKAAALRTLDLSRQVGAAIFTRGGEVISLGSNEVPKASAGTYWSDEKWDDRDWVRGIDSNYQRNREVLCELLTLVGKEDELESLLKDQRIRDSQFMNALEYGRIVHAEMAAICDAARLGRSVAYSILYCTTFPCHMCAKHIVASGIEKVIFLEPYPKSLVATLHLDSIQIEGGDRGKYQSFPTVQFEHFFGITPRRYREIFERRKRKDVDGNFESYIGGSPRPFMDIRLPLYPQLEDEVLKSVEERLQNVESHKFFEEDA